MPNVNDLNDVFVVYDSIEYSEAVFIHDLAVHTGNVGFLGPSRVSPEELDRRKDRRHDVGGAGWTTPAQVLMNGGKVSGCARAVADLHRTPQRFQNDRIASSLIHSPRSSSARPSRMAVSSWSSTTYTPLRRAAISRANSASSSWSSCGQDSTCSSSFFVFGLILLL